MAPPRQGWRNQKFGGEGSRGGFRGGRGDGEHRGRPLCRHFQQTGQCRFGENCRYSHDAVQGSTAQRSARSHDRSEETPEQQQAKADYNSWKRLIKFSPKTNDIATMKSVWTKALSILDGDDRNWKQMLPRDLDDDEYHGREHIQALMTMPVHAQGHRTFIDLARPFLAVIVHPAFLDCLSVDTFVGSLYNFIGGGNGTRAIPFFQRLVHALIEQHLEDGHTDSEELLETAFIRISIALRELLKRGQRVLFHDDLPDLITSIENCTGAAGLDLDRVSSHAIHNNIREIRGMMNRAKGLLRQDEPHQVSGILTGVVTSTYPREIIVPRDRHDNDKMDITKINLLPTEGEIRSDHPPFLPSTDPGQPHFLTGLVERHLDTQFRLLRHDVFGELGEALGGMLMALEDDPTLLENPKFGLESLRAYYHPKAYISYVSFEQKRGLEAQILFPQPVALRKKTASERRKWWEESKRMEEGILLCFLAVNGSRGSLMFFTVSEKITDPAKKHGLTYHAHHATIVAKLATRRQRDLETMTHSSTQEVRGLLVEFPGVLLATFLPILENIQDMQRCGRLPFHQWILSDRTPSLEARLQTLTIPPPLYARKAGFRFSLTSILKDQNDRLTMAATTRAESNTAIDELEARTSLDRGQCRALIAALTREFAFIQGPPGTGKSYLGVQLMRVLLSCKNEAALGPVFVVCYTNHALDQFLEHLIKVGIDKIIRIGGQSHSVVLEGKNLRIVSKGETKSKSEGFQLATAYKALEAEEKTVRRLLGLLHGLRKQRDWAGMKAHLLERHPLIHHQFSRVDADDFETVGREPFDIWVNEKLPLPTEQYEATNISAAATRQALAQATQNVHSLAPHDRRRLVDYWAEEIRYDVTDRLFESVKLADQLQKQITNVHDEVDRRVLETADVVGVTTTGLARRIATLQRIRSKVIICEEAGEVMEPHMISALLPSVEHFIQIGDHEQLRPQINNFKLSLESQEGLSYQLDRSQFERLSTGRPGIPAFPLAQLNVQRRMRPEISTLIKETIYPTLLDHQDRKILPNVVGMRNNVFWLDHSSMEEGAQGDMHQKSHSNLWEVEMVHALVRHILRQGAYNSTDIAVLTPYTGQLQKLRSKLRNDFEVVLSERDQETLEKEGFESEEPSSDNKQPMGQIASGIRPLQKKKMSELLRVATVDNFQGEEAKVVIVTLVRSNKHRKVGFLKTRNRINVLVSRAKHGMYLIGNMGTYSNQPMWAHIQGMLHAAGSVDLVQKVDVNWHAIDVFRAAAIGAWHGVTQRACMKFSPAHNLANVCTVLVNIIVRNRLVGKTVDYV